MRQRINGQSRAQPLTPLVDRIGLALQPIRRLVLPLPEAKFIAPDPLIACTVPAIIGILSMPKGLPPPVRAATSSAPTASDWTPFERH